jgi:hypothetical protein
MSTLEPSKNGLADSLKPDDNLSGNDSVDAGVSELVQLARQSFEDKRRKQSLAITKAILKIDPENKEAFVIQSWVRDDLQKQIKSARTRVTEARRENSLDLYDQAERLLRAVLNVDPESEEATALLAQVMPAQRAAAEALPREPEPDLQLKPPFPPGGKRRRHVALVVAGIFLALSAAFGLFKFGNSYKSQAAQAAQFDKNEVAETKPAPDAASAPATASTSARGSFEFAVVPKTGVQLTVDDSEPRPVPQTIELPAGPHRLIFTAKGYSPETISETVVAGESHVLPVIMNFAPEVKTASSARPSSAPAAPSPDRVANSKLDAAEPVGVLTLSAAVPVDVFLAGKLVGTTPVTVRLPAGLQTLTYRHEGLTKTVTHLINSGQTTTATIVFDVNVQINARPWAQVSIEGPEGRALGQTPLSNVTVAAGSVLIFQNPRFPEKKYRVTGKDNAIQVVFP